MSSTQHYSVAVVGGGPVGMLLAAELGLQGVSTVVLERNPQTVDEPKAGTLHARTVQSLARRGHLPSHRGGRLEEAAAAAFHFAGLPGLTITAPAVEGRPIAGRTQADLERDFEKRARALGVDIRRGHKVTSMSQDPHLVRVTAEQQNGQQSEFTADYAVGADGARSITRTLSGITADEHPPKIAALLGEVRLLDPHGAPGGWQITDRGWTVINVNPWGASRVITFDFTGPHANRHAPLGLDELQATANRIAGHEIPMTDLTFASRFGDYSRLVRRYRNGRIFLAGDAAHVHFPVGGQGLNLGIQDALNLGWKLALTIRGTAGKDLLDTYHDERHPAGKRVVDNTRAQLALMRPGADTEPLRSLFKELLQLDEVSNHLGNMISAQDTAYATTGGAPGEGTFLPNLPLRTPSGDTCVADLLHAGRPVLLLVDSKGGQGGDEGDAAQHLSEAVEPWAPALDIVRAESPQALRWNAMLLRPDGYLAWTRDTSSVGSIGLHSALTQWFGEPASSAAHTAG